MQYGEDRIHKKRNEEQMYYNRKIAESFSKLLEVGGELRWLFNFVKQHKELDFLIGKNNAMEWIAVYRGLSCILKIKKSDSQTIIFDADHAYKKIANELYGIKTLPCNLTVELSALISNVASDKKFNRYYNNKKEGHFQNELSRKYGICGEDNDEFVILDKEAVIGYADTTEKKLIYSKIQKPYKCLQRNISRKDEKQYGKNLDKKAIGNELDFLALDRNGDILLIEYKHGTNTSGIYLSPLQIGMYYDLFNSLPKMDLEKAVYDMLDQKQKIGLINPKWKKTTIKDIIPVLIISEYNYKSSAKTKFQEILEFVRTKKGSTFLSNLKTYNYTTENGLTDW